MTSKQIDVTCPCCSTLITVDVLTGQIMRSSRPDELGKPKVSSAKWDSARERVRERTDVSDEVLDEALSEERERTKSFDDLFRKAQDQARKRKHEEDD